MSADRIPCQGPAHRAVTGRADFRPDLEGAVRARYAAGARRREAALCCPQASDPALLAVIPVEVLERDYGCGDPTRHLRPGETVLDLGSGAGKACFLASQIVGPRGHVIGVDMNDAMLALARRAAPEVARRLGWANVEFRKCRIQDLALDLELLDAWLGEHAIRSAEDLAELEATTAALRREAPLLEGGSVDVVVSNCVLNLIRPEDKPRAFREIHRVLRPGGRAVIADIVTDRDVPGHLVHDVELFSGCLSGALREDRLGRAFEEAGFRAVEVLERAVHPWRVVEGIEFRSVTVRACKGGQGAGCPGAGSSLSRGGAPCCGPDPGHR